MRYREIINEGRMAPLYHFMDMQKTEAVFARDCMPAKWDHNVPGVGLVTGNSFTRNPRYNHGYPVKLTIDQQRLAQRNRIIPLDGELAYRYTEVPFPTSFRFRDRKMNKRHGAQLAEEFVVGDIMKLHLCVTEVTLGNENYHVSNKQAVALADICQGYCTKWNIPLVLSDRFQKQIEQYFRDEELYRMEDGEL